MSLDTVLKIGKALKNSSNCLKYFRYVQPCPKDKKGNYPLCLSVKVNDDFSIDFNNVSIIPENQRKKLYYLTFKTSDRDGLVKYIFGDIYYAVLGTIKNDEIVVSENGYYRLPNPNNSKAYQEGSFDRGKADFESIIKANKVLPLYNETNIMELERIRMNTSKNIKTIEKIFRYASAVEFYFDNNINTPFEEFLSNTEELYEISVRNNFRKLNKQNLAKLNITENFRDDIKSKEKIFKMSDYRLFLHFDYGGQHWYDLKNSFSAVSTKMTEEFVERYNDDGLVLKKTLYKNLCSGDSKNDIQFPNFSVKEKNKSKIFTKDEIESLFYATNYASSGKSVYKTDIKIIVLPSGNHLEEEDYEDFLLHRNETAIVNTNEYNNSLFDFVFSENDNITVFDVIFCKRGGMTSPDSDLVEISGIEKSKIRNINERISEIAHTIYRERQNKIGTEKDLNPLSIEYAFLSILGIPQYDENSKKVKIVESPQYVSHLLKVLPQIYLDNYINDDSLLPSFIQNVESSIRFDDSKYIFMKYDIKFLYSIQNRKNNKYMEITESKSYQLGMKIGRLSKPLKKEISSFQKTYVGMLTRRVATKEDCIQFVNDICQKLVIHEKMWGTMCSEICNDLANIPTIEYDKDKLVFGFFEGYFKYEPNKKDFQSRLEKLIADFDGNEELKDEIEKLEEMINNTNNN